MWVAGKIEPSGNLNIRCVYLLKSLIKNKILMHVGLFSNSRSYLTRNVFDILSGHYYDYIFM